MELEFEKSTFLGQKFVQNLDFVMSQKLSILPTVCWPNGRGLRSQGMAPPASKASPANFCRKKKFLSPYSVRQSVLLNCGAGNWAGAGRNTLKERWILACYRCSIPLNDQLKRRGGRATFSMPPLRTRTYMRTKEDVFLTRRTSPWQFPISVSCSAALASLLRSWEEVC